MSKLSSRLIVVIGCLCALAAPTFEAHAQAPAVAQKPAAVAQQPAAVAQKPTADSVNQTPLTPDPKWMQSLKWRSIGPSSMGGRIVDLAVVESNPSTFYLATASGGLFKTVNYGATFEAQFQQQSTISIGDICVAPTNPQIVWVGTGENNARNSVSWGDGVYKSTDGGKTWKHMGLKDSFQIGRILVHPQNPDIVYVGALGRLWGENEERGVFKTTDGGKTWYNVLYFDNKTGCIDLALSPHDPETIIACMYERKRDPFDGGDPVTRFGTGSGIFKSTDGGGNWKRMMTGLPTGKLGRINVDFSRSKPGHIFAVVESDQIGAAPPGSKLPAFMGVQGVNAPNAARLVSVTPNAAAANAGLKAGDLIVALDDKPIKSYRDLSGKIRAHKADDTVALKVKRGNEELDVQLTFGRRGGTGGRPFGGRLGGQNHNIQGDQGPDGYQTGGVYKSSDGGESWERLNSLNPRPFYFSQIRVDPTDERFVYVLGISLYRSTDGGKTFSPNAGRGTHADHHAMWIDPKNGRHIILGCDGGLNITHDRTQTWEFLDNLAIGQFYHVGIDSRRLYRVYGGLQDNGSWGGPSGLRGSTGPTSDDWFVIGGGDGFICLTDPLDPDIVYYESQYGNMGRVNLKTGERARIRPQVKGERLRFNWKTPFILSHHNSRIYYCAANKVFKSLDRGSQLRPISPNLTRTDRGTATAMSESPFNPGVLYAGTDDGNLWATTDGGREWKQLTVAGLKGYKRVSSIEASRFKAGRAYVALDGHFYDSDEPAVYVTEDFGQTWSSINANLPAGCTRVLREDVDNPDLLYVGTEFAIWASIDRGRSWIKLNNNLPHVAVHEIAVHPTAGEIVAGTHGRSLWILDVTTLRQMTRKVLAEEIHFFQPSTAVLWHGATGKRFYGAKRFIGRNPASGAMLHFTLKERAKRVTVTVSDIESRTVFRTNGRPEPGLHRVVWNLRVRVRPQQGTPSARSRFFNRNGRRAAAGTYLVTLDVDGKQFKRTLVVAADPEFPADSLTFDEEESIRKLKKVLDD